MIKIKGGVCLNTPTNEKSSVVKNFCPRMVMSAPTGGVPPHAAPLLAVRALGGALGWYLGRGRLPCQPPATDRLLVIGQAWSCDLPPSSATFPLLIVSVNRTLKAGSTIVCLSVSSCEFILQGTILVKLRLLAPLSTVKI